MAKIVLKKVTLFILREFFKAIHLNSRSGSSKRALYSRGIIDKAIGQLPLWYCRLLKELIASSTSTIPERAQIYVDYITSTWAVFNITALPPLHLHGLLLLLEESREQEMKLDSDDWNSRYDDKAAREMARLQARDTQTTARILINYGLPFIRTRHYAESMEFRNLRWLGEL